MERRRAQFFDWLERNSGTFLKGLRIALFFVLAITGFHLYFGSSPLPLNTQRASYDWLYRFGGFTAPDVSKDDVVIVYIDELSKDLLGQPNNAPWDRALYGKLLDRLKKEGARAAILDVIFSGRSNEESDTALANALKRNGRAILGVDTAPATQTIDENSRAGFETLIYPDDLFVNANTTLASVHMQADDDFIIRLHYHLSIEDDLYSLSWTAAKLLNLAVTQTPQSVNQERWVRYYGGPYTIPHISLAQALDPNYPKPGFFKNKVVFVGARPTTSLLTERRDEFRNSYNPWNEKFLFMPAVEVHATMFLNLFRRDWLTRLAPAAEVALLLASSMFGAFILSRLKPIPAAIAVIGCAGGGVLLSVFGFSVLGLWTPWLAIVLGQLPAAFAGAMSCNSVEWFIQRQKHEREKKAAARRIYEQAALLDKAQDAIIELDLKGNVTFWNEGALRAYGWTRKEILGKNFESVAFPAGSDLSASKLETLSKGEWSGELSSITKAGSELLVQSRWSLVRDDDSHPKSFLLINTDITEKRSLETQLLRSQRLDSLGTLAGGIAHDLNNVLAPILMGVELLRMKKSNPGGERMLNTIENSARRGADLVKQVLTFARGVEGEQKVIQVRHLLKEMDRILNETFPKSINLSFQVATNLFAVKADLTQMHQVLLNLCVNARDAMPEGGKLRVEASNHLVTSASPAFLRASEHESFVLIKVADSGSGIPPEIAEKIFEPFFTTKEVGKGTGLGLATVVSIVRKHKGFLDFKSQVGEGTEFLIYLPAADAPVSEENPTDTTFILKGAGELILVVDDESAIRCAVEEMLNLANYQVVTATHAQAALEIVAEKGSEIGLVLMDRMMPGMDSLQAMREIKLLRPNLPIICMSGLAPQDRTALDEVTEAFLQKPFNRESLLKLVAGIRSRGAGRAERAGVEQLQEA